jgi:hypothetical protein
VASTAYAIYEGNITVFFSAGTYSHTRFTCTATSGDVIAPTAFPKSYYLIVPLTPNSEGSYGLADDAHRPRSIQERPQGTNPCFAQQITLCN